MEVKFPLILDGATGTQLQKRGYTGEICAEAWTLEHPGTIQQIQAEYIAAGSRVLYAPTFGANRVKLEENGIFNQVEDYNLRLVSICRQGAGPDAYVAGDMTSVGKFLLPMGDISFEELTEIYTEQAAALEKAGVDLFAIETIMTLPEARAALLAVKSVSQKPVIVTFTCDETGKTLTGTDVTAALAVMQGMGADAFGLNCSVGPEDMLVQIRRLSEYAQVPLIAKPNAGMPEIENGKTVYRCTPEEFAALVPQLADAGVALFGGCCGTEAAHVKAVADAAAAATIRKPAPKSPDQLLLATEKEAYLLPADVQCSVVLAADETLEDALDEVCGGDDVLIGVRIDSEEALENFGDAQYAVAKPLCIFCEDAALLEAALRMYQGRAMYEGSLPEEVLLPLCRKYGLVI